MMCDDAKFSLFKNPKLRSKIRFLKSNQFQDNYRGRAF